MAEVRALSMGGAALPGAFDHLGRKIDADDSKSPLQKRLAHQARPTAGIEHQAVRSQVRRPDQALQRRLYKGTPEGAGFSAICTGDLHRPPSAGRAELGKAYMGSRRAESGAARAGVHSACVNCRTKW